MQAAPRFVMIGGFLGAGKTTTISRLANHYRQQGKNVAIVTNDQASDLVDTLLLRSQGFNVGEVAGSCFCCNFNALTSTVESLSQAQRPDIVLAEPVGSCTDLVATVIRPLEQIYEQKFDIAPYGVVIKPSHGIKILSGSGQRGFSKKAEYIFLKQIEEADFLIVNRIDELTDEQLTQLDSSIQSQFSGMPVVRVSAKLGTGFDALTDHLSLQGVFGTRVMDVDYEIYAEGEAELGWLNCQAQVSSTNAIELDSFLVKLIERLKAAFQQDDAEIAHLKVVGQTEGIVAVANLVSNESSVTLSVPSKWSGKQFELILNARVATSPENLEAQVRELIDLQSREAGAQTTMEALQCFRPGKPVPTHRI